MATFARDKTLVYKFQGASAENSRHRKKSVGMSDFIRRRRSTVTPSSETSRDFLKPLDLHRRHSSPFMVKKPRASSVGNIFDSIDLAPIASGDGQGHAELSSVKVIPRSYGIKSRDTRLHQSSELLLGFVNAYNTPPELSLVIRGVRRVDLAHTRGFIPFRSSMGIDDDEIEDFCVKMDLSCNVAANGMLKINHHPDDRLAFRDCLHEYLQHYVKQRELRKELLLQKRILWDFRRLASSIETMIRRSTRYPHEIIVAFPLSNHTIRISSLPTGPFTNRLLHGVTSFAWWIPRILWKACKDPYERTLTSEFRMIWTEDDWLRSHMVDILDQVNWSL